jgi:hypothetical protein
MYGRSDPDRKIAALATTQHGPVTRVQLRGLGLTDDDVDYRVRRGRLFRLYPQVFAVGHTAMTREGRWMAAVLACGRGAVLSHGDAAALWDLLPARGALIHVTTPSRAGRVPDRGRVRLHRVGTLTEDETTVHDGIPVTTPARTLLDVAPSLRPRALEDIVERMDRLALFDLVAVRRCLDAHPRQADAPKLRMVLDRLGGASAADTRSTLEVAFLQLCDDYNLPTPRANTVVAGFRVVRFTYNQVTRRRRDTARRLRALLERSGSLPPE